MRTPARLGWVKVTLGAYRSGSTVLNVTVSVCPARSDVADSDTLKASARIDRVRTVVPSDVVADTRTTYSPRGTNAPAPFLPSQVQACVPAPRLAFDQIDRMRVESE